MRTWGRLSIGLLALVGLAGGAWGQTPAPTSAPAGVGPVEIELVTEVKASDADRDKKLADLEAQIQKLLQEVADLRAKPKAPAAPKPAPKVEPKPVDPRAEAEMQKASQELMRALEALKGKQAAKTADEANKTAEATKQLEELLRQRLKALQAREAAFSPDGRRLVFRAEPAETVMLERTTYKLPAAQAQALGKFLTEHVKAKDVEVKLTGDGLVVTARPPAQQAIRGLVALLRGESPPKPKMPFPPAGTPMPKPILPPGTVPGAPGALLPLAIPTRIRVPVEIGIDSKIHGKVTQTDESGLVSILLDEGQAASKGDVLYVYRRLPKPTYLGMVKVQLVGPAKGVIGRFAPANSGAIVQKDDEVASQIVGR